MERLAHWQVPLARAALFVVYVWFGTLKLFGLSPATPLVHALFDQTIHFMPFGTFYVLFAAFEVLIGVLFVIKGCERVAFVLVLIHLFTTALPLILLPAITWQGFFVPTLEGQYIIKNLLILACAVVVGTKKT